MNAIKENGFDVLLGKLHDSLHDNSRSTGITDTILVGATYAFNILMLFLIFVSQEKNSIFLVFIFSLVIVNYLILVTFRNSSELREKLHLRQQAMYEDTKLSKYFDESVIQNYKSRYNIWMALDVVLGIMVLLVAFLLKVQTK